MTTMTEAQRGYSIQCSKACFYRFLEDPEFGHLKMKWLSTKPFTANLPFDVPDGLVQKVEKEEFDLREDAERLPIFLGSQFGVNPRYSVIEHIPDGHLHFIIVKSMLSGIVAGLSLKQWDAKQNNFELIKKWT
jgi:hypothetical protein